MCANISKWFEYFYIVLYHQVGRNAAVLFPCFHTRSWKNRNSLSFVEERNYKVRSKLSSIIYFVSYRITASTVRLWFCPFPRLKNQSWLQKSWGHFSFGNASNFIPDFFCIKTMLCLTWVIEGETITFPVY